MITTFYSSTRLGLHMMINYITHVYHQVCPSKLISCVFEPPPLQDPSQHLPSSWSCSCRQGATQLLLEVLDLILNLDGFHTTSTPLCMIIVWSIKLRRERVPRFVPNGVTPKTLHNIIYKDYIFITWCFSHSSFGYSSTTMDFPL